MKVMLGGILVMVLEHAVNSLVFGYATACVPSLASF